MTNDVSRRRFLAGAAAAGGLALSGLPAGAAGAATPPGQILGPGALPHPGHPEGTEFLPRIEHIVIYMNENHSYDSYLGMHPRGDGYYFDGKVPQNHNPLPGGKFMKVWHAPDSCQFGPGVSQSWSSTHTQFDHGRMDGFLAGGNTNTMRYWDGTDLPFYYSLAETFPICDRWFAAAPCQTYPNRLYLQAATCQTLIATNLAELIALPHPAGGTIWDKLNAFGITWNDYAWDLPDIALFQQTYEANVSHVKTFNQFLLDCENGALPQVSIVSPGIMDYTEENPADVRLGEAYSSSIINAVMHSPNWHNTALFYMYDEHGGYYDHVPAVPAIPPDDILPGPHRHHRRARLVDHDRPAGAGVRDLALRQARLRVERGARPHVGAALHRDQVQPGGADPARRQRRQPARLLRLQPPGLQGAPHLGRAGPAGHRQHLHAHHPAAAHLTHAAPPRRPPRGRGPRLRWPP